ncbi:hypothetical protein BGZ61DRAFT_540075 [Ilyonectria robusta]|uniref:uncharacterized protein n=1 Tax=Ilyonectria robusta TaxID=1079257 RepID=UPI001E8D5853|nr:uncharacterized protein BGZ61DRAFT_540075 [Ilyonectria robusta]KAH8659736.1 hypothetical protein BGZ61DRAFT_540075 [Ilyonectria robusta]
MDRMFITSNVPHDQCEIQFSLMSAQKECPRDLFSISYEPRQTMLFKESLVRFPQYYKSTAEEWLFNKLVFDEQETCNHLQTASGAWEKFYGRTRMMKNQ